MSATTSNMQSCFRAAPLLAACIASRPLEPTQTPSPHTTHHVVRDSSLSQQHVQLPRHPARHRVDTKLDLQQEGPKGGGAKHRPGQARSSHHMQVYRLPTCLPTNDCRHSSRCLAATLQPAMMITYVACKGMQCTAEYRLASCHAFATCSPSPALCACLDALGRQALGQVGHSVLRVGHRHAVAGHNDHLQPGWTTQPNKAGDWCKHHALHCVLCAHG